MNKEETMTDLSTEREHGPDANRRNLVAVLGALAFGAGASSLQGCASAGDDGNELGQFQLPVDLQSEKLNCIETVGSLKALDPGQFPSECYLVLGHQAVNDAGGGLFYWDSASTETDDGGLVLQPNNWSGSGRWKRLIPSDGDINIRWFGGAVDSNSRAALTASDAAATAHSRGLYIPAGTYDIPFDNGAPNLTVTSPVRMATKAVLRPGSAADGTPQTVTFSEVVDADGGLHFDVSNGGAFSLAKGTGSGRIAASQFGVEGGGADVGAKLQAAVNATPENGILYIQDLPTGDYYTTTVAIELTKSLRIESGPQGAIVAKRQPGAGATITTGDVLTLSGAWGVYKIRGLRLLYGDVGLRIAAPIDRRSRIENLNIHTQATACIRVDANMIGAKFDELFLQAAPYGIYVPNNCNNLGASEWSRVTISQTSSWAIFLDHPNTEATFNVRFRSCIIDTNDGGGAYIAGGAHAVFEGACHFENNGRVTGDADISVGASSGSIARSVVFLRNVYFSGNTGTAQGSPADRIRAHNSYYQVVVDGGVWTSHSRVNCQNFWPASTVSVRNLAGFLSSHLLNHSNVSTEFSTTDVTVRAAGTDKVRMNTSGLTLGSGAWNADHITMGPHHLWVDSSGNLRIKNGAPTSDTDGIIVGAQT